MIRIDTRFRFPQSGRLRIGRQTQCIVAFVHGSVQPVRSQPEYVHEQLPGPPDGFLLEIIPERPVAQHLEERMMVRIETDLFEIVVLSGYPETFLGVHGSAVVPLACSKKNILELVHPGIREEQCGIAMRRQRIARHHLMPSIPEKIEEGATNVVGGRQVGHDRAGKKRHAWTVHESQMNEEKGAMCPNPWIRAPEFSLPLC